MSALKVTMIYLAFGFFWIIGSDTLLDNLPGMTFTKVSIFKGCLFVMLTSGLIYVLLRRYGKYLLSQYEAARDAENNYNLFFESNPIPTWVYDLRDFRILLVNHAAVRKYGYSKEEFYKMTLFDIRPTEDHELLKKRNGHGFSGVWRHLKKGGEAIYVEVESHAITYKGREAKLILATDISQLINAQSEIEAAAEEMNNFVYRASHDLRGPLARLIGLSDLMITDTSEKSRMEYLHILNRTACLMDKMLSRLLSVNRLKNYIPEIREIKVRDMVDDTIELVKESNMTLGCNILNEIPDDFTIFADPKLIQLVLENLLDNSVKYRHPGADAFIQISGWCANNEIHLVVKDNGIGIDKSIKPRIFDLFFRGTERSNGSGLGLYIAQEAIKRQYGKIALLDTNHNETVFEVILPDVTAWGVRDEMAVPEVSRN